MQYSICCFAFVLNIDSRRINEGLNKELLLPVSYLDPLSQ